MGSAYGDQRPSILDNDEHDNSVKAKRVTTRPDNTQMQIDYNSQTDGQPLYVGFAIRGLSTSSTGWMIQKFTYDANSPRQCLTRTIAYDSWANRATATYA